MSPSRLPCRAHKRHPSLTCAQRVPGVRSCCAATAPPLLPIRLLCSVLSGYLGFLLSSFNAFAANASALAACGLDTAGWAAEGAYGCAHSPPAPPALPSLAHAQRTPPLPLLLRSPPLASHPRPAPPTPAPASRLLASLQALNMRLDADVAATPALVKGQLARAALEAAPAGPDLADSLASKSPAQVRRRCWKGPKRLSACERVWSQVGKTTCGQPGAAEERGGALEAAAVWPVGLQVGRIFSGLSAAAASSRKAPAAEVSPDPLQESCPVCHAAPLHLPMTSVSRQQARCHATPAAPPTTLPTPPPPSS